MSHIRYCQEEAEKLGYYLQFTTNCSASYSKTYCEKSIHLEITPDKYQEDKFEAVLSTHFRNTVLSTSKFRFPHKLFSLFENEIKQVIVSVEGII